MTENMCKWPSGHSKTETIRSSEPVVQIDDQFGSQATDLGRPTRFMVPADKNDEGLFDFFSHLTCYADCRRRRRSRSDLDEPVRRAAADAQACRTALCVPTEKLISPGPVDIDHYKCYLATGAVGRRRRGSGGSVRPDQRNRS